MCDEGQWRLCCGGVPLHLMVDYEYQRLTLPRGTSRNAAMRVLTEAAEHGHWELDRLRLYPDGTRRVVLRRRYLKVQPTLDQLPVLVTRG
jgi:hypothetical protein